jgi:flagellar basal-body rod modification protein FlgD
MDGNMQARLNPPVPKNTVDFSEQKIKAAPTDVKDSTAEKNKASFKDVLLNSNVDMHKSRDAQKNGDGMKLAKTDEEFFAALNDKVNQANQRKPQNELDKNAFLKLFVTQIQNQDPLNPDNSSEMAAQLAQFHGLEQMMNVNKNLEKMQNENALARAVGLVDFVGKEVRLDGGRLKVAGGKTTSAMVDVDQDATQALLEVRDPAGVVVASRDLGVLKQGENALAFDGKDASGKRLTDGIYTFSVTAKNVEGQDINAQIVSDVKVTGVDLKDQGGSFLTEVGKVGVNEIVSVGAAGTLARAETKAQAAARDAAGVGAGNEVGTGAGDGTPDGEPRGSIPVVNAAEQAAKSAAVPAAGGVPAESAPEAAIHRPAPPSGAAVEAPAETTLARPGGPLAPGVAPGAMPGVRPFRPEADPTTPGPSRS